MILYDYLELIITLRCNAPCLNCIKLCNTKDVTGLCYAHSDMPFAQLLKIVSDIKALPRISGLPVIQNLVITGGEPLLHPNLIPIVKLLEAEIVATGLAAGLSISTNMILDMPSVLAKYACTYTSPTGARYVDTKKFNHNTALLHPNDFGHVASTFDTCTHYRKWRVVCTYQGYSLCCAADGYIRLFELNHLILKDLPANIRDFPLNKMDDVCINCPFGCPVLPFERDMGRPVSDVYTEKLRHSRIYTRKTKKEDSTCEQHIL